LPQPPIQGQTVPITVAPVPTPYLGAERRGGTFYTSEHRRSADVPIMQEAELLQNVLGNAKAAQDFGRAKQAQDRLFALSQEHPWVLDYIKTLEPKYDRPRGSLTP